MEEYQTRVFSERTELYDKIHKLKSFVESDNFINIDEINQDLLKEQLQYMELYYSTLTSRISLFKI